MLVVGVAALVTGLLLVRARFRAASSADKILAVGPVFEAAPLAVFATEHFLAAQDLVSIVPKGLPNPLFWVYFVGAALLAAAIRPACKLARTVRLVRSNCKGVTDTRLRAMANVSDPGTSSRPERRSRSQ